MKDGPETKPGQLTLIDYGLGTPERPLGSMPWSEFTASIEDKDIRMLTGLWNLLNRLNNQYEDALRRRERNAPHQGDDLGRYGKPFLSKPNEDSFRGEVVIDVDQLYILTQTEELDRVPGVGKKTTGLAVELLNQHIEQ